MTDPYEQAEQDLVDAVNSGEISDREFRAEMSALRAEIRQEAEDAADAAREEVLGRW